MAAVTLRQNTPPPLPVASFSAMVQFVSVGDPLLQQTPPPSSPAVLSVMIVSVMVEE